MSETWREVAAPAPPRFSATFAFDWRQVPSGQPWLTKHPGTARDALISATYTLHACQTPDNDVALQNCRAHRVGLLAESSPLGRISKFRPSESAHTPHRQSAPGDTPKLDRNSGRCRRCQDRADQRRAFLVFPARNYFVARQT